MTTYTSKTGARTWTTDTDWTPTSAAGGPVQGDLVIIPSSAVMTIPASTTVAVGTSPDNTTTWVIDCTGTGKLVMSDGSTLNCYGNIRTNGPNDGTASLTMNSTTAVTTLNIMADARPTTKRYEFSANAGNTTSKIQFNGTNLTTAYCLIQSPSGSVWSNPGSFGGLNGSFFKFNRAEGTSGTGPAFFNQISVANSPCAIADFVLENSGFIQWNGNAAGATASVTRGTVLKGTATNINYGGMVCGNTNMTLTRTKYSSDHPFTNGAGTIAGLRDTNCAFPTSTGAAAPEMSSATITSSNSFYAAFAAGQNLGGPYSTVAGAVDGTYLYLGALTTEHWIGPSALGAAYVEGKLYETALTTSSGDCNNGVDVTRRALAQNQTIQNNLQICDDVLSRKPGVLISPLGDVNADLCTYTLLHNTSCLGEEAGGFMVQGETGGGHTGMYPSVKSNLFYLSSDDGTPIRQAFWQNTFASWGADGLTASGWDYNTFDCGASFATTASVVDTHESQTLPTAANDKYNTTVGWIQNPNTQANGRTLAKWAAWFGTRMGLSGTATGETPGNDQSVNNALTIMRHLYDGTITSTDAVNGMDFLIQWVRRGYIPTTASIRADGHDGLTRGMYGAWAPALSGQTATASLGTVTTNCADGTLYWVITTSSAAPDWDRILAGKDSTGTTVPAGFSGNAASTGASANTFVLTGATLTPATNYYWHVAHKAAGSEAALADYLKTSETVTSAAFQAAASVPLFMHNTFMRSAA